jgi:butyrate kinase
MGTYYILAINPGSTSTKVGVFQNEKIIFDSKISHNVKETSKFDRIIDQKEFRTNVVMNFLKENSFDPTLLSAVVGRGGILTPIHSGTYIVNSEMIDFLNNTYIEHASNLGAIIADIIAKSIGVNAFIVDPVVVDEMEEIAKITGIPQIKRQSIFHALNQKAMGRVAAKTLNKEYQYCNFIVAHLGAGISIGMHKKGVVVDVNNGLNGDGPFSPERAGRIPAWSLVELATSGEYSFTDMQKLITGKGGLVAHLGINDIRDVEKLIDTGHKKAELVYKAMAYNIAKEIGALAPVVMGELDAIVLSGGIAYNEDFVKLIRERVEFLAPVIVFPGEDENFALSQGVLRVLRKEEEVKIWKYNKIDGGKL